LIGNGPEKRDTDFTWREFIHSHNGEILGAYGNFVNRSLVFIQKFFENRVPKGQCNQGILHSLKNLYPRIGELIEHGDFKEALEAIFAFVRTANKYFDEEQPWITVKSDPEKCRETLNTCVNPQYQYGRYRGCYSKFLLLQLFPHNCHIAMFRDLDKTTLFEKPKGSGIVVSITLLL
jgi:methionyl-tRNA synthetase